MVEIIESSIVAPCDKIPNSNERIWLSNLDLGFGHWYISLVSLFRHNNINGDLNFFNIQTLKAALSKALVHFYPYAGRLVFDQNGRPEISCTGEGVPFVVARSKYTIDDFVPSPQMSQELLPAIHSNHPPYILSMFQITFMKCGGVALGTVVHHAVGDGYTVFHYINSWADIARGIHIPESRLTISFDRKRYFTPRNPPTITHQVHQQYPLNATKPTPSAADNHVISAIFKVSREQLQSLKLKLNTTATHNPSTFKALLAYVWRCTCKAWGLGSDEETCVYFPANFRGQTTNPSVPSDYFGNGSVKTFVKAYVGEILREPLGAIADKIETRVSDEYIKSVIDHVELLNFVKYWRECTLSPRGVKNSLYVVSLIQLPVVETDFGWGKPVLMSKAYIESSGVMYFTKSGEGDGGVTVVAAFEPEMMARFKTIFHQDFKLVAHSPL